MEKRQDKLEVPLATLHRAFDALLQPGPAFHALAAARASETEAQPVTGWRIVAQTGAAFDSAGGQFVAYRGGHFLFMASAWPGARLLLYRNGDPAGQPLDDATPLLVAALQLRAGDVVTLAAGPDGAGEICWRGARVSSERAHES